MNLYAKILANTSKPNINQIHHDQLGLIQGMQNWFNIRNSLYVTHHINTMKEQDQIIISTDEKTNWKDPTSFHDKNM